MSEPKPASFLRLQTVSVPVSDLSRSLEFYAGSLGFRILRRVESPSGVKAGFVAPPDGVAILILSESDPDRRMGSSTGVVFVTGNITAQHDEWSSRGVRFSEAPQSTPWGMRHATFHDPDGNAFRLVETDAVTEQIEAERRAVVERAERERLSALELRIATQVQAGLLPNQWPHVASLDHAGLCLQARQVGGDYFDFLDFGHGRLGLVIGDVSGKGIGAALLMANLQAHIRSHYARHPDDLAGLMSSVNRLFQQSTPAASYATLFFGVYDDRTRRLRFVNGGHPPPLVVRRDGHVQSLDATGYAVGMFEQWVGAVADVDLHMGDVLALYTDGVTEAVNEQGDEFGAARLADVLRSPGEDAQTILARAASAVKQFSGGRQDDDITMVIGKVR